MKKLLLKILCACILFNQFEPLTDCLAHEWDRVTIAEEEGEGLSEEKQTKEETKDEEETQGEQETIAKEPEIIHEAQTYSADMEEVSKRTEYSKTYRLGNGLHVSEQYFEPIHKKENGKWIEIDNTLEKSKSRSAGPSYQNKDGAYDFAYENETVSLENENGAHLEIRYPDMDLSHLKTKENAMYFSDVYEDVDMQIDVRNNQVIQNLIFNEVKEDSDYAFEIVSDEKIELKDENINIGDDFTLIRPMIRDADGKESTKIKYRLEEGEDATIVHVEFAEDVSTFALPYRSMTPDVVTHDGETDIIGSYIRSQSYPWENSYYYHLFVGNDINQYSGVPGGVGLTRTFINVAIPNIGNDQKVISADLKLYKKYIYDNECTSVHVSTTNHLSDIRSVTWNNQPSSLTRISTNSFTIGEGYKDFDITKYVQDYIKNGTKKTLVLTSADESVATSGNVFYNAIETPPTQRPKLVITHQDDADVRLDLDINTKDREFRVYTRDPDGFQAISFDGIAKPNSVAHFKLHEQQANGSYVFLKDYTANVDPHFVDQIFVKQPIPGAQTYTKVDANYTTNYIYASDFPHLDRMFKFQFQVVKGNEKSTVNDTDSFIIYEVKNGDTLRSISAYYGVKTATIIADNRLKGTTVKEGDKLLIRFLTDNTKVSPDAYRPPVKVSSYTAKYVPMGYCVGCHVLDPINAASGNYHHSSKDFTLKDYDELYLERTLNSTAEKASSMFGNGWSTNLEQYLSHTKDGSVLYFRGDGRITKITNGKADPKEKITYKKVGNNTEIYDKDTQLTYVFDAYDTLAQIRTRNNHSTNIHYDDWGMITHIDLGTKKITFSYNVYHMVNQITLPDGSNVQYEYDGNRRLTAFIDRSGNRETYAYDGDGQIVEVVDKAGNRLGRNEYDSQGRVIKQRDASGQISTMSYSGNRVQVNYPDSSQMTYEQNNYDITKITDENGHSRSFTYDSHSNIISETNENNETIRYTYDANDNLTKKSNPDGTYEQYRYNSVGDVTYKRNTDGVEEHYAYDANGNIIEHRETNKTTEIYTYDTKGRLIRKQGDQNISYTYQGNDPYPSKEIRSDGLTKTYTYDAMGNLTREEDNQGRFVSYTYNKQNLVTKRTDNLGSETNKYDANGNVIEYTDKNGVKTITTYDALQRVKSINKNGLTKSYTYDVKGNVKSETDEQGIVTSYTYDKKGNQLTKTINGSTTKYHYDARNRLIKTEYPTGTNETKTYKFDNVIEEKNVHGLKTTYTYDNKNRLTKTTYPNGETETNTYSGTLLSSKKDVDGIVTHYTYDVKGNVIKEEIVKGSEKITTLMSYDARNRVNTQTKEGVKTTYTYDVYDNQLSENVNGRITRKTYDVMGRMTSETDAQGYKTSYAYDKMGNQIKTTLPNGGVKVKQYDAMNQLISETDELNHKTTYKYNAKGQMVESKNADQVVTKYSYDKWGNVSEVFINDTLMKKETYDAHNRKIKEETPIEVKTYTYDRYDQIIKETNVTSGLVIETTYDDYGNVLRTQDNGDQHTENTYDAKQRLIQTVDSYGRTSTTDYDIFGRVKKQVDGTGQTIEYTYDKFDNVLTQKDTHGNIQSYVYDIYQNKVEETSDLIHKTYKYDTLNRLIETHDEKTNTSSKTTYDSMGNAIIEQDELGNKTEYKYDKKNQVIETKDALGHIEKQEYDLQGNVIKTIHADGSYSASRYNAYNLISEEVDERGFTTTYTYNDKLQLIKQADKLGGITTITYDKKGNPTQVKLDDGSIYRKEYDLYGRVIKEIDPKGNAKETKYDALGNVIEEVHPYKTIVNVYDEKGNLKQVKENNRLVTNNTYDKYNQLILTNDALNQPTYHTYDQYGRKIETFDKGIETVFTYDDRNNLIKEIQNDEKIITYQYDILGREVEQKINDVIISKTSYDKIGNQTETYDLGIKKRYQYDSRNRLIKELSQTSENKFVVTKEMKYDKSGNVKEEINGEGDRIQYTYDANNNVTSKTDGNGNTEKYAYDKLNQLVTVETANDRIIHYQYDENGNKSAEFFNEQETRYRYDKADRLIEESDATGSETTTYDAFDNVITFKQKNGTIIEQEYDALNRMTRMNDRVFTYDKQDHIIEVKNAIGSLSMMYDDFGNLIETTDPNDSTVQYTYDIQGNKTSITYPNGEVVSYTYNDRNQLMQVSKNERVLAMYQYDIRGNVSKLTQDNIETSYTYDNANRVTRYLTKQDGKVLHDRTYTFDHNDNIIKEVVNGKANLYTYNENDELSSSEKYIDGKLIKTTYQFDIYGNRVESSSDGAYKKSSYNDKNQLTKIETNEGNNYFHYDKNGNITAIYYDDGYKESFKYDEYNQLTTIKNNLDKTITYEYDGMGERISQHEQDDTIYQLKSYYEVSEELNLQDYRDGLEESDMEEAFAALKAQAKARQDNRGCTVKETKYRTHTYQKEDIDKTFVLDRSVEYSQILQEGEEQSIYGLARLESEDTKYITGVNDTINLSITENEVTEYTYDDYGNSEDIEEGFGYNGEHKDNSGLIYLRARYYNPRIGRFLQIDSYKGEDNAIATKNRYTYVANNPYKYDDPSGNAYQSNGKNKNTSSKKQGTINGVLAMVQVGGNVAQQGIEKLKAEQERKKKEKEEQEEYRARAWIEMYSNQVNRDGYEYSEKDFKNSLILSSIFGYIGYNDEIMGAVLDALGLLKSFKDLRITNNRTDIKIYACDIPKDAKGTHMLNRPMDGGRSIEYQNGTIKKAPSIKDEKAWQLRYLLKLSKEQMEFAYDLARILITMGLLVLSAGVGALPFGTIPIGAGYTFNLTNFAFMCINALVAGHNDSRDIDSEIAYALSYHFVDGYNSSMWFTAYFNKDNQLIAKSKPNVFTN